MSDLLKKYFPDVDNPTEEQLQSCLQMALEMLEDVNAQNEDLLKRLTVYESVFISAERRLAASVKGPLN